MGKQTLNFDTVPNALRAVTSAFAQDGWAPLIYNSMAIRGASLQPIDGSSPANSVLFIFIAMLSLMVGPLLSAIMVCSIDPAEQQGLSMSATIMSWHHKFRNKQADTPGPLADR